MVEQLAIAIPAAVGALMTLIAAVVHYRADQEARIEVLSHKYEVALSREEINRLDAHASVYLTKPRPVLQPRRVVNPPGPTLSWLISGQEAGGTGWGWAVTVKAQPRQPEREKCRACELGVHGYL